MVKEEVCVECGGTGWKLVRKEGFDAAKQCECVMRDRAERIAENTNIPPLYKNASFDNFSTLPDNPLSHQALQKAITTANSYAREYPPQKGKRGLLLLGDHGTGKTHLAVAVMKKLISKGHECVFFDYQQLLDQLRASYNPASGSADREAYRMALECEVLVLDDLGAQRVTDWVEDTITSLITYRYNNSKALITTTNLRDSEAGDAPLGTGLAADVASKYQLSERIGMRARSRLFEMCRVISLRGVEDYRMRKNRSY